MIVDAGDLFSEKESWHAAKQQQQQQQQQQTTKETKILHGLDLLSQRVGARAQFRRAQDGHGGTHAVSSDEDSRLGRDGEKSLNLLDDRVLHFGPGVEETPVNLAAVALRVGFLLRKVEILDPVLEVVGTSKRHDDVAGRRGGVRVADEDLRLGLVTVYDGRHVEVGVGRLAGVATGPT